MSQDLARQIYNIYVEFVKKHKDTIFFDEDNKIRDLFNSMKDKINVKIDLNTLPLYLVIYFYTSKYDKFNIEKFKIGNASFMTIMEIISSIQNIQHAISCTPLNLIIHFGVDKTVFEYFVNNGSKFITDSKKINGCVVMIDIILGEKFKKFDKTRRLEIPVPCLIELYDTDSERNKIICEFTEYLILMKNAEITGFILLNYINLINNGLIDRSLFGEKMRNKKCEILNKTLIFKILKFICHVSPHLANTYLYMDESWHGTFLSLLTDDIKKENIDELKQMGFMKTVHLINTLTPDPEKRNIMKNMCFTCNVNPYKIVFPERYKSMMENYNQEKKKMIAERNKEYLSIKRLFWSEFFVSKNNQKVRECNEHYEKWKTETEKITELLFLTSNSEKRNIFELSEILVNERTKRQEIYDKESVKKMCIDTFISQLQEKQNNEIFFEFITVIKQNPNIIGSISKCQNENYDYEYV